MVKVNFPQTGKRDGVPEAYRREFLPQQAIDAVVRSANRSLMLVSGGPWPPCPPRHHLSRRSISFRMSLASGYDDQDRYDRQEHDISHRLADT